MCETPSRAPNRAYFNTYDELVFIGTSGSGEQHSVGHLVGGWFHITTYSDGRPDRQAQILRGHPISPLERGYVENSGPLFSGLRLAGPQDFFDPENPEFIY